jgi:hypothetical protein
MGMNMNTTTTATGKDRTYQSICDDDVSSYMLEIYTYVRPLFSAASTSRLSRVIKAYV